MGYSDHRMEGEGTLLKTEARLVGNGAAREFFMTAIARDRLAHAYLVTGPEGVGKRVLATEVAAALLGTDRPVALHPDFFVVERERDEKTGNLNAGIRVGQADALRARLASAAMMGGWKVAVIDGADLLLAEAANRLLKTVEEPHPKTLILMLAGTADAVLPTIRSRCQHVELRTVPHKEIADALVARGVSSADASLVARISDGRPSRAFGFVEDPGALDRLRDLRTLLLAVPTVDVPERWQALDRVIPPKAAFNDARVAADGALALLGELCRDALLCAYGEAERTVHADARTEVVHAMGGDPQRLAAVLAAVTEARSRIAANVNPRTVLQHLFAAL